MIASKLMVTLLVCHASMFLAGIQYYFKVAGCRLKTCWHDKRVRLKCIDSALFATLLFCFSTCYADELIIEPDQGRAPIVSLMNQADSSLQLVMYGLTDQSLINALNQAKKRGVNVEVLLESHPYEAFDENLLASDALKQSQINLHRTPSAFQLIHQKTLLIDQRTALIMTFNFTHSSFKNERNFGLVIHDPKEIQEIEKVFNADWQNQTPDIHHPDLIWSPDNSRAKIVSLIKNAHDSIKLYAQSLSNYQVIGALAEAAKKGVDIKIILQRNAAHKAKRKLAYLKRAGCQIHFNDHYYIHAKVMIIDDQEAMLGSINFTNHSLDSNRELSIITRDSRVLASLNKTFLSDY